MADVPVTFGGDFTELNRGVQDLTKVGKQVEAAVGAPLDGILKRDAKVRQAVGNLAYGLAYAKDSADALNQVMFSMDRAFKMALPIATAVTFGFAIKKSLDQAAEGYNKFFDASNEIGVDAMLAKTADDVERLREKLKGLEGDKADDGFIERALFGVSKAQGIQQQLTNIEVAAARVKKLGQEALQNSSASSVGAELDNLTAAIFDAAEKSALSTSDEMKALAQRSLAQISEMRQTHAAELTKAEAEYKSVQADPLVTPEALASQKEMIEIIKERHKVEARSLEEQSLRERQRLELTRDVAQIEHTLQMDLLGVLDEREQLELKITASRQKLAEISRSEVASEKERNAAVLEHAKILEEIAALRRTEMDAEAAALNLSNQRKFIGRTDLDQQRIRTLMLEQQARGEMALASTADEKLKAEEKLTAAAGERVKLVEMERQENEKLLDIQLRRQQAQNATDPIKRAELALQHAESFAARTQARSDASPAEKEEANFRAEQARRDLLDVAAQELPSLQDVAGAGNIGAVARSRAANRSALNDPARAQQSEALRARARDLRARRPYDDSARTRADSMEARADRLEAQALDLMDDTPSAEDRAEFEGSSPEERRNKINQRRLDNETKAREREAKRSREKWEREHPLDAKKKRDGLDYDASEEPQEDVPSSAEAGGGGGGAEENNPMAGMAATLNSIDASTKSIDTKLPLQVLK